MGFSLITEMNDGYVDIGCMHEKRGEIMALLVNCRDKKISEK